MLEYLLGTQMSHVQFSKTAMALLPIRNLVCRALVAVRTLVETAGTFYKQQACMQGIFFIKPRKFSELRMINHVEVHCIFHYCNKI